MTRAYCFKSGAIGFGCSIPAGATVIARGPREQLEAFIAEQADEVGPPAKRYHVVPHMGRAANDLEREAALLAWSKWIAASAPREVRVLSR